MKIFCENIENLTLENQAYRNVLFTDPHGGFQMVVMNLRPKEEIGMEVHPHIDQFIRVEKGDGVFQYLVDKKNKILKEKTIGDGSAIIIPKGVYHNVKNTSKTKNLKLYALYLPPEHLSNTIQFYK